MYGFSSDKPALTNRRARIHVAAAIHVVVNLGGTGCRKAGAYEVHRNMPIRIAAMQPHCSGLIRSRSTSAANARVTSG